MGWNHITLQPQLRILDNINLKQIDSYVSDTFALANTAYCTHKIVHYHLIQWYAMVLAMKSTSLSVIIM